MIDSQMQIMGYINDQTILEEVPSLIKKNGTLLPINLSIHVETGSFTINIKTGSDLDNNPQLELLKSTISQFLEQHGVKYFVAEDQLMSLMMN